VNWYKQAQLYEYVNSYPDEYSDDLEAHRYFSIGQNEETIDDSFCWVWANNKLQVAKGPTTHNMSFGWKVVEGKFKGWYDPVQNLISVVFPRDREETRIGLTEEDIPGVIRRSLYRKFGDAEIIVF